MAPQEVLRLSFHLMYGFLILIRKFQGFRFSIWFLQELFHYQRNSNNSKVANSNHRDRQFITGRFMIIIKNPAYNRSAAFFYHQTQSGGNGGIVPQSWAQDCNMVPNPYSSFFSGGGGIL